MYPSPCYDLVGLPQPFIPLSYGTRIRIDNTRLFPLPPTTTPMTSDVVANQLVLFTMLQSFSRIPEE